MEDVLTKIKFKTRSTNFYADLSDLAGKILTTQVIRRADFIAKLKLLVCATLFLLCYFLVFSIGHNLVVLCLLYVSIGFLGILLAFNGGHDAVHDTFSKSKKLNRFVFYFTFNLLGVNANLWRKRHIASHHIFPNVDGCDADIDNNPVLRLSKAHPLKRFHKYQHLYVTFIYAVYSLHWILVKDFVYLYKRKLANLQNHGYSIWFKFELVFLKLLYFCYMIVIPTVFTGFSFWEILAAFLIMHFTTSIFLVYTLAVSHLSSETVFPTVDTNGMLPFDYYEHQLAVSIDFHPTSPLAGWLFGGFNAHSAHHLFPKKQHTLYARLTPAIKEMASLHNLPYHETSFFEAIAMHLKYLKKLGKP